MDDIGTPGVPDRSRYGYSKQDVRSRGVSGHRYILHNRLLLLCRSALRLSINCRIQEQYGQYDKERDTDSSLQTALCITRPAFDGDVPDPYFPQSDVDFGRGGDLEPYRSICSYLRQFHLYTKGAGTLYGSMLMYNAPTACMAWEHVGFLACCRIPGLYCLNLYKHL